MGGRVRFEVPQLLLVMPFTGVEVSTLPPADSEALLCDANPDHAGAGRIAASCAGTVETNDGIALPSAMPTERIGAC